jgi:protein TonB
MTLRLLLCLLPAAGVTVLLFGAMQAMILAPTGDLPATPKALRIDFLRLASKPPPPPPQRHPPPTPPPPPPKASLPTFPSQLPLPMPLIPPPASQIAPPMLQPELSLASMGGSPLPEISVAPPPPPPPPEALLPLLRPPPIYPSRARRRGLEGWVRLAFVVTARGQVEGLRVEASRPPGVFDKAAVEALKRWRFQPSVRGESRPARQTLHFQLGSR